MIVGLPRESKAGERRVALVPSAVRELVAAGHAVRVARGAGEGAGHPDSQYAAAGALLVAPEDAWRAALVVKVKEIQPGEEAMLAPGTLVFAFQHLVGEPQATRALAARGVDAIAFELVRGPDGGFPILAPMSVIAGRLAVQAGAHHLTLPGGGAGVLLAGAPGSDPARVLVLGGGHAGASAALAAAAMGAEVTVLTRSESTRDRLWSEFDGRAAVDLATPENIASLAPDTDLVVGAVFVPGEPTPKLLPRTVVASMRPGRVIVDVSIDAGGVAETSRPTTHADPVYVEEGVVHYAVANMPAAVPRAASAALSSAILPFVLSLASGPLDEVLAGDPGLAAGLVLRRGEVTHRGIAEGAGLPWREFGPGAP